MTERSTRIRWNEEERSTILAAYQSLLAKDPTRGVAELFAAAQKALPPARRRSLDHKLRVWLASEAKHARAPRRAPSATPVATASPVAARPGRRPRSQKASPPAGGAVPMASAPPDAAAIARAIVELGSAIVADILQSARVQQAFAALLRAAWPTTTAEAPAPQPVARDGTEPTAGAQVAPEPGAIAAAVPANGKLRVLIAGMERREGAVLAKTYDDTLELVCWSAEDGPERLPDALRRADVVVGMTGVLSQPVEQTLRRHAKRYVRNARGVAGLRSELAGLALSGHGAAVADAGT